MPITNAEIAEVFDRLAALVEIEGDSPFKVRAYQRAARTITSLPVELSQMVQETADLRAVKGIGEQIAAKIHEIVTTGQMQSYERKKAALPEGVLTILEVPGIGPKTAYRIATDLGVTTVDELERALADGRVAALPRMGEKATESILQTLQTRGAKGKRLPVSLTLPIAEQVIAALRERCPSLKTLAPAGSLRRFEETVGDIDLMGTSDDPEKVLDAFADLPLVSEVLVHGPKKASVLVKGMQIDLRIVPEDQFGSLMQYFTGSREHNIQLRELAVRKGLSINEYGITHVDTGEMVAFSDEASLYSYLDLQYIPPELRQGLDEIDLARQGAIPHLIEEADLLGDLHAHTDQSDGRDPLEAMIQAARERGLQYIAITDHSRSSTIANGLNEDRLRHHVQHIRELDSLLPDIKVLAGSEVDIRADGTMDYSDEILADLDFVVGSVHSAMEQDKAAMTRRVVRAMENPRVDVIGHLTCRLLGHRHPTNADVEVVLQAALRTGTAVEINCLPHRLDIKDTHARRARDLGVPMIISTDSHKFEDYSQARLGIGIARRAWCEPKHVLNTLPLEGFLASIKGHKRR
ncbi:MAG: DNA polymerase (family 10) [Chloroflexi bacterium]|jgi:DNA polymerase (family 10)|nr:MAG: DNA polymerase (family 10) [Chloroflexota bacterium]